MYRRATRGQFFKRIFEPTRRAHTYATVALGWVGAYARVDTYASFKKLASDELVKKIAQNVAQKPFLTKINT
jgi:hypothetical protein